LAFVSAFGLIGLSAMRVLPPVINKRKVATWPRGKM
jgi:hypothetical protein